MSYKKQPICNLCQAAGKKDFNHYTHDKITGKTTCPYLLTVVCKNCNKKAGHTAKYCPQLKQKEKEKEKQAPQAIKHSESLKKTVPPPIEASLRSHSMTKSWANAVNHQSSSSEKATTEQAPTKQAPTEQAPTKQASTEHLPKDIPEFSLMYRCRRRGCTRLVYGDSFCECVKNEPCMPQEEEAIPKSKNDWFEHGQYGARLGDGLYLCGGRVVDRGPTARPIDRVPTLNSTKSSEHKNAEDAEKAENAEKAEDAEDAEENHAIKINAWADDTAEWMASLDQNRKSYL
jgi:hypothetical protein